MSSIHNPDYINKTYPKENELYAQKLVRYLIKKFNIKKGDSLLDIGCGSGLITKCFLDEGILAYGIDISHDARKNISEDKLTIYDLQKSNYPFPNENFDFVFSKSVVEHLINPDILFDETFRILKKNGVLICMTPSWKHSFDEAFYIDHTHVTPFTKYSLKVACELSGFVAKCEYFYQLPIVWKYPIMNIIRFIIQKTPIPYRPFSDVFWPDNINKVIRFSKEAMLLCKAEKK